MHNILVVSWSDLTHSQTQNGYFTDQGFVDEHAIQPGPGGTDYRWTFDRVTPDPLPGSTYSFKFYRNGILAFELDQDSEFPLVYDWHGESGDIERQEWVFEPCPNSPDGQAYLSVIATDVDGNKIAEKYPFDYTQGFHTFDVNGMFSSPLETLLLGGSSGISMVGYIVHAPKGFTAGNIEINELYHTVQGGFFEHSGGKFEISLQDGSNKGQIISPHWLVSMYGDAGYPIPVMFSGQVTLNCNFAPLPVCMPDSGDTITTDEYIAEQPIAYPPLGPDPVPPGPIEPVEPISPIEPVEPIVEPLPPEIVLPSQPVEPFSGCECEIYVGKQIGRLADGVALAGTSLQNVLTKILGTLKTIQKTQQQGNDLLAEGVDKVNESLENLTDDLMEELRYDFEALDYTLGDLKDCLRLDPCEPEYPDGQTITEVLKEFVEQYEPPLVEVQEGLVAVNQDSDRVYRSNLK